VNDLHMMKAVDNSSLRHVKCRAFCAACTRSRRHFNRCKKSKTNCMSRFRVSDEEK